MIKINLLKSRPAPGANSTELGLDQDLGLVKRRGLAYIFVILLNPAAFYLWEIQTIPQKQANLARAQAELSDAMQKNTRAKDIVSEIKKFKSEQEELQAQIASVESLSRNRLREIQIMDLIQKEIPEKVWITKLEIGNSKMLVSGNAATDADLISFMEVLSRSAYLKEVNLVKSDEQVIADVGPIKHFEVSGFLGENTMNGLLLRICSFSMQQVLLFSCLAGGAYYFMLFDDGKTIDAQFAAVSADLQKEQAKLAETNQALKEVEQVRATVGNLIEQFKIASAKLPTELQMSEVIKTVDQAAQMSTIAVKSKEPKAPSREGVAEVLPMRIQAEGGFSEMGMFFYYLATTERLMKVRSLTLLGPQDFRRSNRVTMDAEVVSYKFIGKEASKEKKQ